MQNKKIFSLFLILVCTALLLSSCQSSNTNKDESTSSGETQEETTAVTTPTPLYGIWYSEDNQTVVNIQENLNDTTLYLLKYGYYEYESVITGSCTYSDYILTMTTEDGESYSWVYDSQKGALSASNDYDTSSYTPVEELPTQCIEVFFPDYSSMKCEELVTLGAYTGLTPSEDCYTQAAIEIFDSYYAESESVIPTITDRAAKRGDYVNIDYTGYLDGVAFDGGTDTGVDLAIIEDSGYIAGFAEGIINQTVGSTFDVKVTFPADYGSSDLAGKEAVFTMTLNAIYDLAITDENIAAFTESAYATYQAMLDDYASTYIQSDLWNQVLEKSSCAEMTEDMYGYFLSYYRDMYHYYAYYYGIDYETLLSYYGITEETFVEQAKVDALQFMTIYAIAAKNDLQYTQESYDAALEEYIQSLVSNGYTQEEAEAYTTETQIYALQAELLYETVMEWLVEQNVK